MRLNTKYEAKNMQRIQMDHYTIDLQRTWYKDCVNLSKKPYKTYDLLSLSKNLHIGRLTNVNLV